MKIDSRPVSEDPMSKTEGESPKVTKNSDGSVTVQLTGYQTILKAQWEKNHTERAPIYLDKDNNPIWLNRKERRHRDSITLRKLKKNLRAATFQTQQPEISKFHPLFKETA